MDRRAAAPRAATLRSTGSTPSSRSARRNWPFLSEYHARRLTRAYGTRIDRILGKAQRFEDLGIGFGADLTEAEVRYLMQREWAVNRR